MGLGFQPSSPRFLATRQLLIVFYFSTLIEKWRFHIKYKSHGDRNAQECSRRILQPLTVGLCIINSLFTSPLAYIILKLLRGSETVCFAFLSWFFFLLFILGSWTTCCKYVQVFLSWVASSYMFLPNYALSTETFMCVCASVWFNSGIAYAWWIMNPRFHFFFYK